MKEKIYTIPINEAYDEPCGCPLCRLERALEEEACAYALGAAMMEPDFRVNSNEKGFCRRHTEKLFALPNKLSLALVLDTGVGSISERLDKLFDKAKSAKSGGLFKKDGTAELCKELCDALAEYEKSCVICEKGAHTMARSCGTRVARWATEAEVREKFARAPGLCLPHLRAVMEEAARSMPKNRLGEFLQTLGENQKRDFAKIGEDVHRFTLKFDYRNRDMEWGDAKDAPRRAIEKLCGYTDMEKED